MTPVSKNRIGLRFGFITGLLYFILLFCRFKFFSSDPHHFVLFALVSYLIIVIMYLFSAIARKNELGGYADLKEIFTAVFIVILITELTYIVFNLVYFKMVDPAFWGNFQASARIKLNMDHIPQDQIEEQMKSFKEMENQSGSGNLIKGYGISVVTDSVFGLIFAIILRKKNPAIKKFLEDPK